MTRSTEPAPAITMLPSETPSASEPTSPPPTKKQRLIDLLRAKGGSDIAALADATRWQPHTVRAAVSRLKADGYVIERSPRGDGAASRYTIITAPPDSETAQTTKPPDDAGRSDAEGADGAKAEAAGTGAEAKARPRGRKQARVAKSQGARATGAGDAA